MTYHELKKAVPVLKDAEEANKFRLGLKRLRQYLAYGKNSEELKKAYEIFRSVRDNMPSFEIAYLYEGIALDLLERHDEAITLFQYLKEHTLDKDLKEKAHYNEAVSRFRKYEAEELKNSIDLFDQLIVKVTAEFLKSPIKTFSLAGKANAVAHRPIFWQNIIFGDFISFKKDKEEFEKRKKEAKPIVERWQEEVLSAVDELLKISDETVNYPEIWSDSIKKQLQWTICNAKGNIYLNIAAKFFVLPHISNSKENGKEDKIDLEKEREKYLKTALSEFNQCQMLLNPGVETLTNIATVNLNLSNYNETRDYCQRAIELNPDYEYAYYRLAQSWEKEKEEKQEEKEKKVIEVLDSFKGELKIPGFVELYNKYMKKP
jgi:tetratricopeptide (TPR) repeat protein